MKNIQRFKAPILALGLSGVLAGCAETEFKGAPKTDLEVVDLYDNSQVARAYPGDTIFAYPETDHQEITERIDLIDHQYPNGFQDKDAPLLSQETPIRVEAHVVVHNKGNPTDLAHDLACDTINVELSGLDLKSVYVGAIALSDDDDDKVMISWPEVDTNEPGSEVYICFDDGSEPAEGVVLFVDDQLR